MPRLWEIIRDWWMRHPARLVLWHLPPCWPIVLISVAAPIILSTEQYQEFLATGLTSHAGSYLFLQLALQLCLRGDQF